VHLPSFEPGTVVVLPFPFTDSTASKRRPAVVVSTRRFNDAAGHFIAAMVTSAEQSDWPQDVPITQPAEAGLTQPCLVRMKLFTLDARLVLRAAGRLSPWDWSQLQRALAAVLPPPAAGVLHETPAPFGAH